jgi:hypothetical protein
MTVDYMETASLFRKAADLIERDGWAIRSFLNEEGAMCVIGAIGAAEYGKDRARVELEGGELLRGRSSVLLEYLDSDPAPYNHTPRTWVFPAPSVIQWNDVFARDAEMVITALRNAADWAEGRAAVRREGGA